MIESFCCALIALILRVLAGVYEEKFSFLIPIQTILLLVAIVFGIITVALVAANILQAILNRKKK